MVPRPPPLVVDLRISFVKWSLLPTFGLTALTGVPLARWTVSRKQVAKPRRQTEEIDQKRPEERPRWMGGLRGDES
jgi:hypothetical protein